MSGTNSDAISDRVKGVPFWWHSIDLGLGIVTPGHKTPEILRQELDLLRLPMMSGKTVLDIGAWDGFYSFEAEKRGAARVVALDHYVWSMDIPAMTSYWKDCKEKGIVPQQYDAVPGLWQPDVLPGKRGFDLARDVLHSKVSPVVADFTTVDLDTLGTFDITLYLGVLYHMQDPLGCLKRLARVTRELAVIETAAVCVPGFEDRALCEFYESNELNADVSNWWAPSLTALLAMCRAAGFSRVEATSPEPRPGVGRAMVDAMRGALHIEPQKPIGYRAIVHAWKSP